MPIPQISEAARTLAGTLETLRPRFEAMQAGQMDWTPGPDYWTPREVMGHLADVEANFVVRIRLILAEDSPAYPAFAEEAWTEREQHARHDFEMLYAAWRALRAWNLALIEAMTPEDLRRAGHHAQRGRQTLQQVIEYLADHDHYHFRRLEELAALYKEAHA